MPSFTLHEPAPTRTAFGRGGAGNRTSNRPGPPSSLSNLTQIHSNTTAASQKTPKSTFSSGRGGAGNMHAADEERRLFSFDEELERQHKRADACAPVYHIGRGGQGNLVDTDRRRGSSGSEDSNRKASLEWIKGITGRKASS